ncbi:hypothetical protein OEZ85_011448 [Tetradesmus obliquus]|uniref:C2 domain-containing protein n=1 Tax=Tetradesmus obliquus TaxID=3088 RepID=A0ABY8TQG1_TETOB|nr:hypothetical protein OEZ85_011448 [Tetradesmus obliquus]
MYRQKTLRGEQKVLLPPTGVKAWPDKVDGKEQPEPTDPCQAWRKKQRRVTVGLPTHRMLSVGQLLAGVAGAWATVLLLFLAWWKPHLGMTGGATGLGMMVGLLYTFLYYKNVKSKQQYQQVLSMDPGLKGCQYLLGTLPSWITYTEREKMEWFNRMLEEMWPYYDRGICATIKQVVEPIIESFRPPTFKKIWFEELTFGEAPFRVEGIAVRDLPGEIDMEVDVRWCGDANISIAIDLPMGGEFTRLTPKVKDIVFVATFKVMFRPLVDKIPGFAAVAVAFKGPPIIKYRLDFGAVPSTVTSVMTAPIRAFVDMIINMIVGWYLWPSRLTVPLLSWDGVMPANDPEVDLEVERLNGRPKGVIKVHVIQAKELKAYDTLGKSDPFVELFTTKDDMRTTRVINNNLAPEWNEVKYLPVLEKDTVLRLEMFDYDAVNVTSFAGLKSAASLEGGREFMGRAGIPLAQFINEEGLEDELWLPLGKGEWTNLEGPGQGEGWIKLGLQYRALDNIAGDEILHATQGLLMVSIIRCYDLSGSSKQSSYVTVKLEPTDKADKAEAKKASYKQVCKTPTIARNASPRWSNQNKFTLYDVSAKDTLVVSVMEPAMTIDDELGRFTMAVRDIIQNVQVSRWSKEEDVGYVYDDFNIGGKTGKARIELELEFLPYW